MLGAFALAEPDEARYAEIPREMIESGDWVTPHLNYVKYFEKPPLVYWLTAINFQLFGMSEFVARLWPAIFALLGIGMAYALGRSMFGPWTGYAAAALLAATPLYFGLSQIFILDMPLSGLMTVSARRLLVRLHATPNGARPYVWLLYAATALAVLTKGPVAPLLIGAIIVSFLLLQRNLGALRWLVNPDRDRSLSRHRAAVVHCRQSPQSGVRRLLRHQAARRPLSHTERASAAVVVLRADRCRGHVAVDGVRAIRAAPARDASLRVW